MEELEEGTEETSASNFCDLEKQLERNFASLLLKMQAALHLPESTVQEVVEELCEINKMSEPLLCKTLQ